jgi:antitoxin (DNA-binding transcriptional repressor) of toxin-antitoxin stability system
MKTLTVAEAQSKLSEIIYEVNQGEVIVLKDGDRQVTLSPGAVLDLDEENPELEMELLKGLDGESTAFSPAELHRRTEQIIQEHSKM